MVRHQVCLSHNKSLVWLKRHMTPGQTEATLLDQLVIIIILKPNNTVMRAAVTSSKYFGIEPLSSRATPHLLVPEGAAHQLWSERALMRVVWPGYRPDQDSERALDILTEVVETQFGSDENRLMSKLVTEKRKKPQQ
ncbi:hypothetical protein RRG08_053651 [Elysia crispata]|uniref:Uncharacterized protein n=1 Tax=Elysia crispata TaxID=231223 RepID=A0AAE1DJT9_9GAST|nr:hypothetical protein RRG08_053651 [Elysia crispata]